MKADDKKAARAAYKERHSSAGVYVLRCAPSGQAWVGRALDLDMAPNRLWFTLRHGNSPHRSLQMAWTTHGAENFTFEILERLEDEAALYLRDALLKERLTHWRSALQAAAI